MSKVHDFIILETLERELEKLENQDVCTEYRDEKIRELKNRIKRLKEKLYD